MDLNQFDTRQKAEAGVWVPLEINGETIYGDDDEPIQFQIKGMADEAVHALMLKQGKATRRTPKEVRDDDMKLARTAVTGWTDNFEINGEKLEYSKANVEKVFANPTVRQAVLAKVFDHHVFMNGA
jgi:uncharacterized protein with HEPN domain